MLGRSLFALHILDTSALGQVTLVQTAVLVIGLLHFGLWNGGYRLLCEGDSERSAALNRMAWGLIGALSGLAALAAGLDWLLVGRADWALLLLAGLIAGVATLARTWVSNQMLAEGALAGLNRLSLVAALGSLVPLAAASVAPLGAIVAAIALQPVLFVVLALTWNPVLRPRPGPSGSGLISRTFAAGFALFAVGLGLQLAMVAERAYVTERLGVENLGRLFLAYLYITLFQLVPNALEPIFLRRLVLTRQSDVLRTGLEMGAALGLTSGYCLVAVVATVGLGPPLLALSFPDRAIDFPFVLAILPGLILFTLASPLAIMFNVLIAYRAFWIAYGAGTGLTLAGLGLGWAGLVPLDLMGVAGLRSLAYGLTGAILIAACITAWRRHPEFRPRLPIPSARD